MNNDYLETLIGKAEQLENCIAEIEEIFKNSQDEAINELFYSGVSKVKGFHNDLMFIVKKLEEGEK